MPEITWDETMSTGLATVDAQHKQLIGWLNDMLMAMGEGHGRGEIARALDKLQSYANSHFDHEEICMTKYNCPVAAQNANAHNEFRATLASFREEFDRTGPSARLMVRTEAELMKWIYAHIIRVDSQLAPCVKAALAA